MSSLNLITKTLTKSIGNIPGIKLIRANGFNVEVVPKGKRGRKPVSDDLVHTMRKMRLDGRFTLSDIAFFVGVSQLTVFKYTKGINNFRRRNTTSRIHRRTGLAA